MSALQMCRQSPHSITHVLYFPSRLHLNEILSGNGVFPNEEDLFFKNIEVQFDDPHVERVRRAHRNDMENILPYFIMALIYVCTNPNPLVACNLFRVAAIARIVHTLVYAVYPVPQPSRILAFATMMLITFYMAAVVALRTLRFI
ncbi:microsomal glutathione S-transferase 1 isoform X3 [Drosophila novamexicana]|uniref:microsomal glutathione S-transferase 1 isoform X3 n=1 Tax=Drosophila novamexicana TaxID=47314 RepID=UPI0011E5D45F|nr:microsomal glutathione S-transferase 1 isoform X3 [Drosophila novamexicana]